MIRIERDGAKGIAELVIDHPEKRNALSVAMLDDMQSGLAELAADRSIGALVLRGEGKTFCAGFDLPACLDDPEQLRLMLKGLSSVIRALRRFPVPVIAGVQGGAVAGGCALLGGADVVIVDQSARLGYPVLRLGISPAVTAPLLALLGRAGRERLLDPELVDAHEARRIGLAHIVVDLPEDVAARARREAAALASKPRHAVARTRAWLNEVDGTLGNDGDMERALEASLSLVGGAEERALLGAALARPGKG